eukprot:jgi/Chrpa1/19542/Chrysochromulina_OHIO_Genome00024522-RA
MEAPKPAGRPADDGEGRKVFVGGIPFGVEKRDIQEDFSKFGPIEDVYLPMDRETRKPRGFGFVTFVDARDANEAVSAMHGSTKGGRLPSTLPVQGTAEICPEICFVAAAAAAAVAAERIATTTGTAETVTGMAAGATSGGATAVEAMSAEMSAGLSAETSAGMTAEMIAGSSAEMSAGMSAEMSVGMSAEMIAGMSAEMSAGMSGRATIAAHRECSRLG